MAELDLIGEQLLRAVGAPTEEVRRTASDQLAHVKQTEPERLFTTLVQLLRSEAHAKYHPYAVAFILSCGRGWNSLPEPGRAILRQNIIALCVHCPHPSLGRQLAEAIALIAQNDYPTGWPSFPHDLASAFDTVSDYNLARLLMNAASTASERYRHSASLEDCVDEVRPVVAAFQRPIFSSLKALSDGLVAITANPAAVTDAESKQLTSLIRLGTEAVELLRSLTQYDITDEIEETLPTLMNEVFGRILSFECPPQLEALLSHPIRLTQPPTTPATVGSPSWNVGATSPADDDPEPAPIDTLRAAIISLCAHLFDVFAEETAAQVSGVCENTWRILGGVTLAVRHDTIAAACLGMLVVVVRLPGVGERLLAEIHRHDLVNRLLLPCLQVRRDDLEGFIRNADDAVNVLLEGGQTATRYRSASDLVAQLVRFDKSNQQRQQLLQLASVMIEQSNTAGDANVAWERRATAVNILIATVSEGVTRNRGLAVLPEVRPALFEFIKSSIIPVLVGGLDTTSDTTLAASAYADRASHYRLDAIRVVVLFRDHVPPTDLTQLLRYVAAWLYAGCEVTRTFAAVGVHRVLDMETVALDGVLPILPLLLGGLLRLAVAHTLPDSGMLATQGTAAASSADLRAEATVAAIERSLAAPNPESLSTLPCAAPAMQAISSLFKKLDSAAAAASVPVLQALELTLRSILGQDLSKGLTNPQLMHHTFDAAAALVRACGGEHAVQVYLYDRILPLLARSVIARPEAAVELMPYTLQLLGVLASFSPSSGDLPTPLAEIAVRVATDTFARQRAVAPALTRFLTAVVKRAPASLIAGGSGPLVGPITTVISILLVSRTHSYDAFNLIFAVLPYLDSSVVLDSAVAITKNVLSALYLVTDEFSRRPNSPSSIRLARQYRRNVVLYLSQFAIQFGPETLQQIITKVKARPTLYEEVVKCVLARYAHLFNTPYECRIVALALTMLVARGDGLSPECRADCLLALLTMLGSEPARQERQQNAQAAEKKLAAESASKPAQAMLKDFAGGPTSDRFVSITAAAEKPPVVMEGVDAKEYAKSQIPPRIHADVRGW